MQPKMKTDRSAEGAAYQSSPSGQSIAGTLSQGSAAAALQSQLARSSFDRDDTNRDGMVGRDEFMENNMKPRQDGWLPELADVVDQWNKLDNQGKGSLSRDEYVGSFSSLLTVSVGQLSKPLR